MITKINYGFLVLFFQRTFGLCLLLTMAFFLYHIVEERILLTNYIDQIENEIGIKKPYCSEEIIFLRNFILNDINYTDSQIAPSRPKIGWTVREILKKKQGLCGEGSRLLFHILKRSGIESRRIYLHGNNTLHVIIEYLTDNDEWVLLDTINGPGVKFSTALDKSNSTIKSLFEVGPYRYHVSPTPFTAQFGYKNYSYMPFNGLFNNRFFKTEIYVHRPAPNIVNYFHETHEVFLFLLMAGVLVIINIKSIVKPFKKNKLLKNITIENLLNNSLHEDYEKFLKNKKDEASYFHSLSYFNVLKKTKGMKPVSILVLDHKQKIRGSLIGEISNEIKYLPYFTRRLIIYEKPIYESTADLEIILTYLNRVRSGLFVQVRSFQGFTKEELRIYQKSGYNFIDHLNSYISIKGLSEDDVANGFKKDRKKGIKKAQNKYDLLIKEYTDIQCSVNIFYQIQQQLFKKKRHALKEKEFFLNMLYESSHFVRIAFAMYNDVPIATQLYVMYGNKISALYTATLQEHYDKHAGDLLIWHVIIKGIDEKLDIFDFGGGGNPSKPYSPRDYKARFGATFENVGRLVLPKSILYNIAMWVYYKLLK